jgi:hypothetical protein
VSVEAQLFGSRLANHMQHQASSQFVVTKIGPSWRLEYRFGLSMQTQSYYGEGRDQTAAMRDLMSKVRNVL